MIKHIIFDLGGVIVDYDKKKNNMFDIIAELFHLSKKKAIHLWDENRSAILQGEESLFSFLQRLQKILGDTRDTTILVNRWKELSVVEKTQVNWELLGFIEDLKKNYKVYLFTDTIDTTIEINQWLMEIINRFDRVFISYRDKFKKPESKAFYTLLEKIQAEPETCLFIDDLVRNISVAEKLGMQTIQYKNYAQFKKQITKQVTVAESTKHPNPFALSDKSEFYN